RWATRGDRRGRPSLEHARRRRELRETGRRRNRLAVETRVKRIFDVVVLVCAALVAPLVHAQAWPTKPVKFIVPQGSGGTTDVFARYFGQKLAAKWGQPVVVENKPGAAGVVGTDIVAKSAPDGYTMLVTYAGSQAVNQALYSKLPFDSVKD